MGGYELELRYKAARSTDIDLTVQGIAVSAGEDQNQIVREMLQHAADVPSATGSSLPSERLLKI
jgi:hypothetical protein